MSRCISPINPHRQKRSFRSRAAARRYVRQNQGKLSGRHPYECPECGAWHLSSREHDDNEVTRRADANARLIAMQAGTFKAGE